MIHQPQPLPKIWCAASRCCEIVVWECDMWWWPARPFIHSSWAAAGHTGISSSGAMLVWAGQHKQLCVPGCISRLSIKTSRAWERFGRGEQRSRRKICKGRETNKANCHLFKLWKVLFSPLKFSFFNWCFKGHVVNQMAWKSYRRTDCINPVITAEQGSARSTKL